MPKYAPDQFYTQSIYTTDLIIRKHEGITTLNEQLREVILKKEREDPGIQRSNAAATWHSENNIMKWGGPPMNDLIRMFNQSFTQMAQQVGAKQGKSLKWRFQAWAMVSRDGDYGHVHTHPNAHFSGVYYIDVGKSFPRFKDSGHIEFIDTRGGAGIFTIRGLHFQQRHIYEPEAGLMLTFPGWLPHMVHPFRGEGERIAVACNATVTEYDKTPTPMTGQLVPGTQKNVRSLAD